jgi:adenosylcobyric acid synthase
MGITEGAALSRPALHLQAGNESRPDGAISEDGQILATYLHGLFDAPDACEALLRWAGVEDARRIDYHARRLASIETLADVVTEHVRLDVLWESVAYFGTDGSRHRDQMGTQ